MSLLQGISGRFYPRTAIFAISVTIAYIGNLEHIRESSHSADTKEVGENDNSLLYNDVRHMVPRLSRSKCGLR